MNIYLSINNREEEIQIPVLPSSFQIGSEYGNSRIDTVTHDEIMHIGNKRLTSIGFSSFFPSSDYSFLRNRDRFGWDYINTLGKWRSKKIPIRLIITNTSINVPVVVTSLEYSVQDGTGDIYYSLGLEEYKFVDIQKLEAVPIAKPKPVIVEAKKASSSSSGKKSPTSSKYSTSTNSKVKEQAKANSATTKIVSSEEVVKKFEDNGIKFNEYAKHTESKDNNIKSSVDSLLKQQQMTKDIIKSSKNDFPNASTKPLPKYGYSTASRYNQQNGYDSRGAFYPTWAK